VITVLSQGLEHTASWRHHSKGKGNYFCELNEDEYGRPYYGPYDEYHPPSQPHPVLPSQLYPVPSYPPHSYPTPDYPIPEPKGYRSRLPAPNSPPPAVYLSDAYAERLELVTGKKKRQSSPLPFPACVISNECTQRLGKLIRDNYIML